MTVEVELFGHLLPGAPRRRSLSLACGTTVQEITARLGLDPESVGLIVINGVQGDMGDRVPSGCRLCLFPPVSGG